MSAKNRLLGSGVAYHEDEVENPQKNIPLEKHLPAWRYKEGKKKLVTTAEDMEALELAGWVDSPGKVSEVKEEEPSTKGKK
jgi:hypothetical protein